MSEQRNSLINPIESNPGTRYAVALGMNYPITPALGLSCRSYGAVSEARSSRHIRGVHVR